MKTWLRWALPAFVIGFYVSCSPKQFAKDPNYMRCQNSGLNCISQNGRDYFEITETADGGKVDILIVDDNSASMSYEQARLANRFSGFIQNLDAKLINYRIGVTTTDVSGSNNVARSINQNGSLQDGNLIAFSGGAAFLTRDSGNLSQKDTLFKSVIRRPETLACEQFITNWINAGKSMETDEYSAAYYNNCPSGDERGIYAANLTVKNNPSSFIRPEADLAVIVLSDEDVRSQLYYYNQPGFELADMDKPAAFKSQMSSLYPGKQYAVHSIITKDASCLSTQNGQTMGVVNGSYGLEYANLSNATGGILGDICANDYAAQLQSIFNNLAGKIVDRASLACANPPDLSVNFINNNDPSITWSVDGSVVKFSKKLATGTSYNIKYSCTTL